VPIKQNPSTSMAADALIPKPHIERDALGIVLLEPFSLRITVGRYLDALDVTDLVAGVDVDKYGHWSLFSCRFPQWDCLPDSRSGGGASFLLIA
jgi:hypothetical protein